MNFKLRPLPYCVAAALAVLGQSVHAEETLPTITVRDTAAQSNAYEATTSGAATKVNVPLRDVPQAVNVVPKAVLRDQNALSVQDALQNVPGLSFSVGDGQRDQVTIRGFTAISDQFVDGVRDDALYYRDLSNIERIEVLKGPASVLYGRGSAGGLINRVTKKPVVDPLQEVGATIGSKGQRRAEFDVGTTGVEQTVLFRVTGALEDSTGFRNQYFLQRQAIAPSAIFRLGRALLHKSEGRRDYPSPRRNYATAPTGTVLGRPSCVKRLSRATRTCNSTTCRSNVRAITRWPRRLKQCILVSTRLLR